MDGITFAIWNPISARNWRISDGLVIDTGGGAILRAQNVEALKKNGTVFWLTASVETIAKRIGGDNQRPSLTGTKSFVDEIQDVLRERTPNIRQQPIM